MWAGYQSSSLREFQLVPVSLEWGLAWFNPLGPPAFFSRLWMAAQRASLPSETLGSSPVCGWGAAAVSAGVLRLLGGDEHGACNQFPTSPSVGDLSPLLGRLLTPLTSRCGCGSLEVVSLGPGGHPNRSPVEDAASPGVVPRSHLLPALVGRPLPPGPDISSESSPASSWCLAFIKRRTLILVSSVYIVYTNWTSVKVSAGQLGWASLSMSSRLS